MALSIEHADVQCVAAEVASLTGETKTEAIRRALLERNASLTIHRVSVSRKDRLEKFLRVCVWPSIPENIKGSRLTRMEREILLGYGAA